MRVSKVLLALLGVAAISAGVTGGAAAGLEASNWPIVRKLDPGLFTPDMDSKLKPLYMVGCRNGLYSAMVVLTAGAPIEGISAVPGDLTGAGTIAAENVQVFYMRADGRPTRRGGKPPFDSLEEVPPGQCKVMNKGGQVTQPIWIRVSVPKDAKPGDYTGNVKVTTAAKGVNVPLKLKVYDYELPPVIRFHGRLDVVQSPESVAMAYGVELWSDAHFKLLDRSFRILGEMGSKTLYITAVRRTHFGNEHAMVRWTRDQKGELNPDFTIVEKYLDAAVKHMGKVPGVIFYCWEPIESMGHAGGTGSAGRTTDKPIMYTLWDRKRNKLKKRKGPAWGTPASRKFWKKFTDGVVPMLKKHGMEKSLLFGLIGDSRPTKTAMDDICNGIPREMANWAVHSHHDCPTWKTYYGESSRKGSFARWSLVVFLLASGGLGVPWGPGPERPVVGEHPPDYACQLMSYDYHGVGVVASLPATLLVAAIQVGVMAVEAHRRQVQDLAQVRRAALADVRLGAGELAGLEDAGIQSGEGCVLPGVPEVGDRVALGVNRRCDRRAHPQTWQRGAQLPDSAHQLFVQ